MDPKGGARVCQEIRQERGQLTPADLLVTSIPQAGHYPFLDQPDLFMKALLEHTKPYRCVLFITDVAELCAHAVELCGPDQFTCVVEPLQGVWLSCRQQLAQRLYPLLLNTTLSTHSKAAVRAAKHFQSY